MWTRVAEFIGGLWGKTTTALLAIGIAIAPVLQALDPETYATVPWLKWVSIGVAFGVPILRAIAPPPPSVAIHTADQVVVDHEAGTVTVTKASAIPDGIVTKAAGEKV